MNYSSRTSDFLLSLFIFLLAGCMSAPSTGSPLAQIANPASKNCAEEGGRLTIEKNAAGSEYGVCIFDVDHQ